MDIRRAKAPEMRRECGLLSLLQEGSNKSASDQQSSARAKRFTATSLRGSPAHLPGPEQAVCACGAKRWQESCENLISSGPVPWANSGSQSGQQRQCRVHAEDLSASQGFSGPLLSQLLGPHRHGHSGRKIGQHTPGQVGPGHACQNCCPTYFPQQQSVKDRQVDSASFWKGCTVS